MTAGASICGARVLRLRRPLTPPVVTAFGRLDRRDGLLLVLVGEDGAVGLGEAAPLPERGTEGPAAAAQALEALAGALSARPRRAALRPGLRGPDPAHLPAAAFALSTALADLAARRRGVALARWLLRDAPARLPQRVPVNALLVAEGPAELEAEAAAAVERGHGAVKLKVGQGGLARDVDRVAAVRQVLGPGVGIRADANGAWDLAEARRRMAALRPFDLEYLEQPLPARDWGDLARLRRAAPIPVAVDESASDLASVHRLLSAEAADVWVLKPALLGGLEAARDAVDLARGRGVGWVLTSLLDGAVACAAVLHLAASLGPRLPTCGIAPTPGLSGDVATLPAIEAGAAPLPPGAGLGVELAA